MQKVKPGFRKHLPATNPGSETHVITSANIEEFIGQIE
jgi:hypothetical protein